MDATTETAGPAAMPLGDVCRRLGVTYSRAWGAVMSGAIAAERRGSRWFVRAADLPWIAAELGAEWADDGDQGEAVAVGRRCHGQRG